MPSDEAERVIELPEETSVGTLSLRKRGDTDPYHWETAGEARGPVAVPIDREVRLTVNAATSNDPHPLRALRPGDLQAIDFSSTDITDDGLANVGALKGLEVVDLQFTRVGDRGLAHLQGLGELRELYLTRSRVGDAGLANLETLRQRSRIRDCGVSTI